MSTFQSTQQVLAAPTQGMTQPQPQGASQSVVQSMAPAAVSPAEVSPAIATVLSLADMFVPLDTIQPGEWYFKWLGEAGVDFTKT